MLAARHRGFPYNPTAKHLLHNFQLVICGQGLGQSDNLFSRPALESIRRAIRAEFIAHQSGGFWIACDKTVNGSIDIKRGAIVHP